jgi:hypothetical protein
MTRPKFTIADQLADAQKAINNAQADPEIKALLAAYGYNDQKLAEGSQLAAAVEAAIIARTNALGAQAAASKTFADAQAQAFKAYQTLSKVARAAAAPATLTGLGLDGPMPRNASEFQKAALKLFNGDSLAALAEYGYDEGRLTAERAKISAFQAASERQDAVKGAIQQANVEQATALTALNKWTAQYIKIARVALSGTQLSEKLGVTARTSPTAAQRAARAKKTTPPPAATPS